MAKPSRLPTYFISHGGGPWSYMGGEWRAQFSVLERSLRELPASLPEKPKAVLMISGHWEAREFAVMSAPHPPMVYDYSGFPPETYRVRYEAPGDPSLAVRVGSLIASAGLESRLDPSQGFDHGAFVPMSVMYPHAEMPLVQVSMQSGYDPAAHLALGRALAPLRSEGVLIVGSGLSYHNLAAFDDRGSRASAEFDAWLSESLSLSDRDERERSILGWSKAPSARRAHPREDHLLPLHVALGAAIDEPATRIYHEAQFFGSLTVSSWRFG